MKLPALFLTAALLAGCSAAPPRPSEVARGDYAAVKDHVTRLIRHEMDEADIAGLSIALVDDQRIVWAEGFGHADREKETPATAETLYRVGSISKLFTDIAALQLAEQGRLDLDRPLRTYLPDFGIKTRHAQTAAITPRQLMTHHAGLPRDRMKGFMTADPRPFGELIEDIRDDYAAYPPGLVFSYSNVGISLLGAAVQAVDGMPFADHMRQSVLAPLGMANSSFDPGLSASPLMARGHRGREPASEPSLRDMPAGGLNASAAELGRFMAMLFAGGTSGDRRILKTETVAEMLRPQNAAVALDFDFRIGLGWILSSLGRSGLHHAGAVAHHSGGTALFRSQMYVLPEHKLGVVVLANSSTAGKAADRVAVEALSLALEAKTGIRQPESGRVPVEDGPLPAESVQEYAGDYTTVAGLARIYAAGKGLRVAFADHDFDVVRRADGRLGLEYRLLGLLRIDLGEVGSLGFSRRHVGGRDLIVVSDGSREMLAGERLEPPSDPGVWRRRLGEYEITNRGADHQFVDRIRLTERDGRLIIELTPSDALVQAVHLPLLPLSDSEGLVPGALRDGGDTVRSVLQDGEELLAYSGYLLRRVK